MREKLAKLKEKQAAEATKLHSLRTRTGRQKNSCRPPTPSGEGMEVAPDMRQLRRQLDDERAQRGAAAAAMAEMLAGKDAAAQG
eukprot:4072993-Pleurochrysis_carterae.AAC.2